MSKEKFLPIGSVVLLKNGIHRVMILGFCPTVVGAGKRVTTYDYFACLYPEGLFSANELMGIYHKDIVEVTSEGFSNEDDKEFRKKLNKYVDKISDGTGDLNFKKADLLAKLMEDNKKVNE